MNINEVVVVCEKVRRCILVLVRHFIVPVEVENIHFFAQRFFMKPNLLGSNARAFLYIRTNYEICSINDLIN